jgi:hypothetical protein
LEICISQSRCGI